MVTPSGSPPTFKVATIFCVSTSSTLAVPASSFATYNRVPSGLTATCSGSDPPFSTVVSFPVARSITPMPSAVLSGGGSFDSSTPGGASGDPLSATNSRLPSAEALTPRGRLPSGIVVFTACVDPSMTVRSPDVSFVTYTPYPPGGGSADAGGFAASFDAGSLAGGGDPHATNARMTAHRKASCFMGCAIVTDVPAPGCFSTAAARRGIIPGSDACRSCEHLCCGGLCRHGPRLPGLGCSPAARSVRAANRTDIRAVASDRDRRRTPDVRPGQRISALAPDSTPGAGGIAGRRVLADQPAVRSDLAAQSPRGLLRRRRGGRVGARRRRDRTGGAQPRTERPLLYP